MIYVIIINYLYFFVYLQKPDGFAKNSTYKFNNIAYKMKINYQNISVSDSLFNDLLSLYELAFPEAERRPIAKYRHIAAAEPRFHICVATLDGAFAGFITYWAILDFVYIEHLAVMPDIRGLGIGRNLLALVAERAGGKPIIFEVEPDADEISHKRIVFYQRLGYILHPNFPYIQPAYAPGRDPIELQLMTSTPTTHQRLHQMAEAIKENVYLAYF